MPENSRRDFLKLSALGLLSASGLISLLGLLRFLGHPSSATAVTQFELGPAENFPPGSRTVVAQGSALLIHAPQGFVALSLRCTHLGCTVQPSTDGFACPCHNSKYDPDGMVTRGPATHPLQKLLVQEDSSGILTLHTD